jgi:transcriptional regulator with XRE-family HTH domain
MTPDVSTSTRDLLSQELERRSARNGRYSMRAFARSLGLSHTLVSLVLSGRRGLSPETRARVVSRLGLPPETPRAQGAPAADASVRALELDQFHLISDWYHFAILSLLEIPRSKAEPRWIAARLGISELQAKLALERLLRLGLLARSGRRLRQSGEPIRIGNTVSTAATRKFHQQLLEKARESLEADPIEERDFTSMTFALDPARLELAKSRIRDFRRALVAELESHGRPRRVYELTVQLFPVSRPEIRREKPMEKRK